MDKKLILMVLVLGLFLLTACSPKSEYVVDNAQELELTGETKEFRVKAFQFGFEPSVIEVNEGDTVRITAWSSDVAHGLAIPQFGVNMYLSSNGAEQTVEFVADKKGTFTFYCSVMCGSGHRSMYGQLIVN